MIATKAQELCGRLNALTREQMAGEAWWQDIVEGYDYDRAATETATRAGLSKIIVFPDSTIVYYYDMARRWQSLR